MSGVIKINTNGVIDTSFNGDFNSWWGVHALAQFPASNSLLVGGNFNDYKGTTVANLVKIHSTSGAMQPCASTPTSVDLSIYFAYNNAISGTLYVKIGTVIHSFSSSVSNHIISVPIGSSVEVYITVIGSASPTTQRYLYVADSSGVKVQYVGYDNIGASTGAFTATSNIFVDASLSYAVKG